MRPRRVRGVIGRGRGRVGMVVVVISFAGWYEVVVVGGRAWRVKISWRCPKRVSLGHRLKVLHSCLSILSTHHS